MSGATSTRELRVLELLSRQTIAWTADAMGMTRKELLEVTRRHCGTVDENDRVTFPPSVAQATAALGSHTSAVVTTPPVTTAGGSIAYPGSNGPARLDPVALSTHTDKRVQRAAVKAQAALEVLTVALAAHDAATAERAAQERAKVAAQAEVARLEKQLAAAKAKLRGRPTPPTKAAPSRPLRSLDGPSAKDIRTWARAKGITVPDKGPLSAELTDAYMKAHADVG